MKFNSTAFAISLFVLLPSAGWGGEDFSTHGAYPDPCVIEAIAAKAVHRKSLLWKDVDGHDVACFPNRETLFSGWRKTVLENGYAGMLTRFEQGKFDGPSFELYSNGLKKWEDFWRDGELNGTYTWWYENGKKKLQGVRRNGLTEGKLTRWYSNGRVKWEQTYENDRLNGPFTTWYRSGRKKCDAIYRDNQWTSFVLWCPDGDMAWNESRWEGNQDGSYVPWVDEEGIETLEDFFRTDPKIVEDESPIDFERKDPEKEGEAEADLILP